MRRLVAVAFCLLWTMPAAAQPALALRVDSVFAEWDRSGSPGCALGVISQGQFLYERGYGYANLDYDIPNGPDMVYYVGSVSKQFTAASIALLAQQGRISLDDDVRRYLPELPIYERPITIRHLVHHTSGLRDIYTLMSLAGIRMEDVFTDEDALALIARQKELNFLPGDDYLYSNTGYWLLGQIVERVTGQPLRDYARTQLFEPLGMASTHFHDEPSHPLRNRVVSYAPDSDGYRISYLANFDKVGAGGLYTTLGDLLRWDHNFYSQEVGGEAFQRTVHTRGVLRGGDTLNYAFGLTIGAYRGLPTVRHSGSLMGFRAELVRFPEQQFSVAVLCNLASIDATRLANRVAEIYLGDALEPAPPPVARAAPTANRDAAQPAWRPDANALRAFAGEYSSEELDTSYRITWSDEGLRLHRKLQGEALLVPFATDTFAVSGLRLQFERDRAGAPVAFTVEAGRVRDIRFARTR